MEGERCLEPGTVYRNYGVIMTVAVELRLLKHCPEVMPVLAEIWCDVMGKKHAPDVTVADVIERFTNHYNEDALPLTFVAFVEGQAVGMCSLRGVEKIRHDLSPWLGSLAVSAAHQGLGIAKVLIKAVKQKALAMGVEKLYLFTLEESLSHYYANIGWTHIATEEYKNKQAIVMDVDLLPEIRHSDGEE